MKGLAAGEKLGLQCPASLSPTRQIRRLWRCFFPCPRPAPRQKGAQESGQKEPALADCIWSTNIAQSQVRPTALAEITGCLIALQVVGPLLFDVYSFTSLKVAISSMKGGVPKEPTHGNQPRHWKNDAPTDGERRSCCSTAPLPSLSTCLVIIAAAAF